MVGATWPRGSGSAAPPTSPSEVVPHPSLASQRHATDRHGHFAMVRMDQLKAREPDGPRAMTGRGGLPALTPRQSSVLQWKPEQQIDGGNDAPLYDDTIGNWRIRRADLEPEEIAMTNARPS
jgi:hypothetical protein